MRDPILPVDPLTGRRFDDVDPTPEQAAAEQAALDVPVLGGGDSSPNPADWTANLATAPEPMLRVLDEVRTERAFQDGRWGEQNHPDGTGPEVHLFDMPALPWHSVCARIARNDVDERAQDGRSVWSLILLEEVFEALAEGDPVKLRRELVQAAAVAVSWVEAIDRRQAREVTT